MGLQLVGALGLVLSMFPATLLDGFFVGPEHLAVGIGGCTVDKLASRYFDTLLLPVIRKFGAVFLSGSLEELVCQVA